MKTEVKNILLGIVLVLCMGSTPKDIKEEVEKLPKSYVANRDLIDAELLKKLKASKEVNTVWDNPNQKAGEPYRKLIYELIVEYAKMRPKLVAMEPNIALAAGEPVYFLSHPEIVILINGEPMCAGPLVVDGKRLRGIEFEQDKTNKQIFGVTRWNFLHEITHLAEKHYYRCSTTTNQILFDYDQEITADLVGALVGKCETCTREVAEFYFDKFAQSDQNKKMFMIDSFAQIDAMDPETLHRKIKIAQTFTKEIEKSDHPISIERVLNFILYAKRTSYGIKGALCRYHKQFGGGLTTKQMFEKMKQADEKLAPIQKYDATEADIKRLEDFKKAEQVKKDAEAKAKRDQFWKDAAAKSKTNAQKK